MKSIVHVIQIDQNQRQTMENIDANTVVNFASGQVHCIFMSKHAQLTHVPHINSTTTVIFIESLPLGQKDGNAIYATAFYVQKIYSTHTNTLNIRVQLKQETGPRFARSAMSIIPVPAETTIKYVQ